MLIKCPSCNTEYDCEPGKYECECGAKFLVEPDGDVFVASTGRIDDSGVRISPRRTHAQSDPEANDVTMPGRHERKPDGQFEVGDLILGRYKVLSVLGRGGMGVVYECLDDVAGIKIALKALPPELSLSELEMEDVKENFQLVHNLRHPNIAGYNTLERDNSNGNYYLIMECVEGEDLRRRIKRMRREGSLTLGNVLPVVRQVAAALDYAHKQKIIHRDIKPGNIMIDAEDNVKVLDFGLAAQIHTSMTRVSMASQGTGGTAPYMAPEQWRGWGQDAAADQYALAVMTYEMLAGHLPFDNPDPLVLQQAVLTQEPRPIEGLPEHVQAAISRALSKDPANRFRTCSDFVAAMDAGKPGSLSSSRRTSVKGIGTMPVAKPVDISGSDRTRQKKKSPVQRRPPNESSRENGKKRTNFRLVAVVFAVAFVILTFMLYVAYRINDRAVSFDSDGSSGSEQSVIGSEPGQPAVPSGGTAQQAQIPLGDKTVVLPGGAKLELVKVEAGSFEMSAKVGENESGEVPHRATLTKDFYIGRTEVTQAQWKAVMGNNPSKSKGDDLPVEQVTWNEAMAFCEKLNSTGKAPSGWKFTLPTETQWEFAARGGNKSKGYKYSGSDNVDDVAWYYENSGDNRLSDSSWPEKLDSNHCKTHPVGRKKANELGLYDMSGNAWEWCLDDWQAMSNRSTAEFTRGNDKGGSNRTVRGGGWDSFAGDVRSTDRGIHSPNGRSNSLGFRIALVPAEGYAGSEATPSNATQQKPSTGQISSPSGGTAQQAQIPPGDKTVVLPGGAKLELVKVEAGTFTMSAKDGENNSNEVTHSATLTKDFYIGRTEVTQAQWKAMMGSNPSNFKGDDHPVEKVTWNDAMEFCEKLNTSGRAPKGWKYSLPTETQWEYAARGGKKSKGYKYSGSNDAGEVAWYWNNAEKKTHPVGQKKANELGLYDMSGNVMEWCLDDWKDESDKVTAEFTRGNDRGSSLCARRGGSWNDNANFSRSAGRNNCSPGILYDGLGFRVALVPESY